jgi:hypothetical protein
MKRDPLARATVLRRLAPISALLLLAANAPGPQAVFADLSGALSARDSGRVLACFTRDARAHYARVLAAARGGAGANAMRGFSNSDRALVRVLRRRAPEMIAEAKTLDALAALGAKERDDWNAEAKRLQMTTVDTGTGRADGLLSIDGSPTPIVLALMHEEGRWRIHRVSSPLFAPDAVRLSAAVLGVSEEQAVDVIVDRLLTEKQPR